MEKAKVIFNKEFVILHINYARFFHFYATKLQSVFVCIYILLVIKTCIYFCVLV